MVSNTQTTPQTQPTSRGYSRMLTKNEHRFLNSPISCISLVVRLNGTISEANFRYAIQKVRILHPHLGVKIQYDDQHQSWFTSDNVPENPIHIHARTSSEDWKESLQQLYHTFIDFTKFPLASFALILGENQSEFIIYANHCICDGMSLNYLARDIIYYLAHPEETPNHSIIPVTLKSGTIEGNVEIKGLTKAIMDKIIQKWETSPKYFETEDWKTLHANFWKNYAYNTFMVSYNSEETKKLAKKCRNHGVTINTALTAAFQAALYLYHTHASGKYLQQLGIAVNLRDRILDPTGDFFGCFASGIAPKFKYNIKKDFWKNAQLLHEIIHKQLDKQEHLKNLAQKFLMTDSMTDAMTMAVMSQCIDSSDPKFDTYKNFREDSSNILIKSLKKKGAYDLTKLKLSLVITNLGRIPYDPQEGDLEIERMFFTPSAGLLMEIVLGVITANGTLEITVSNISDFDSQEKLKKIADLAKKLLDS